jgi:hypothetical protein
MTVWNISDLGELNERIVKRHYPITNINTTLQKLGSCTYATALDLHMGYYTIRLDPIAVFCVPSFSHGAP